MDYVTQSNQPSIDQFCAEHFISHSTLLRKTAPVRKFLGGFRLKLSLTQAKFTGDEKQVRLFLHAFYWLGYHGTAWPFNLIDAATVRQQYLQLASCSQDPITQLQEQVFWAVCRTRLAHGFTVKWGPDFYQLFAGMPPQPLVYSQAGFPRLTPHALRDESNFFEFFQAKNIRFTLMTPRESSLLSYLQGREATSWDLVARLMSFLDDYDEAAATPLWEDPQLVMNLLRLSLAWSLMGGDYVKQADFFTTTQLSYKQRQMRDLLGDFVDQLPETPAFAPFKTDRAAFIEMLFLLFVPYLSRFKWTDRVHVALWMASTDIGNAAIRHFLQNISVVALMAPEADLGQADLIITSPDDFANAPLPPGAGPRFDWYLDATETDYYRLYQQVFRLYEQKLAAAAE
ncbi:helix-turn-helix domain-containing protein [Lacticaseibacillus parakribbianus]|uniref:helix-turn-helix domain-containing protein n=1 Tax=Lacticaseibacillus parakribbianus TaxID=2970927 RepID=UPI0021CB745E